MEFDWNHSETIALAKESCTQCQGNGLRRGNGASADAPCNCVLRSVFRVCYSRFQYCAQRERHMTHVRLAILGGRVRRAVWGRKDEEFIADFCLVSKRYLDEEEYKLFRFHFLLGADWKLCCRQLKMERGVFFHNVYRIQQKLGRAFCELQPYALYPLDEYFGGNTRQNDIAKGSVVLQMPEKRPEKRSGLRPPLRKVA